MKAAGPTAPPQGMVDLNSPMDLRRAQVWVWYGLVVADSCVIAELS